MELVLVNMKARAEMVLALYASNALVRVRALACPHIAAFIFPHAHGLAVCKDVIP